MRLQRKHREGKSLVKVPPKKERGFRAESEGESSSDSAAEHSWLS